MRLKTFFISLLVVFLSQCTRPLDRLLQEELETDSGVTSLNELINDQTAYVLFFSEETCNTCIENGLFKLNGLQKEALVFVFCFKGGLARHWTELYPNLEFLSADGLDMHQYFKETSNSYIVEYKNKAFVRVIPVGI